MSMHCGTVPLRFEAVNPGFHILRYGIPDSLSVEIGFKVPIVRGIPDSLS